VVVATHYPFINVPGYYFLRMHQERSYVVAIQNAQQLNGYYVDAQPDGLSFRNYEDLLLLGGADHRTGNNKAGGSYEHLRKIARRWYPNSQEKYHWSTQDCMPQDSIPYIGQYSEKTPNVYVATGFNKWGMSSSMVSAIILSDMIMGNKNEFAEVFSPHRFNIGASAKEFAKDGFNTAAGLLGRVFKIPSEHLDKIKAGKAGIIEYEDIKAGVYKDKEGKVFVVSTKCPHLGCQLNWNPDELSWDCPCHGSRFDYRGNLLDNPAMEDIKIE
jgi:Rieske Fe-S protein